MAAASRAVSSGGVLPFPSLGEIRQPKSGRHQVLPSSGRDHFSSRIQNNNASRRPQSLSPIRVQLQPAGRSLPQAPGRAYPAGSRGVQGHDIERGYQDDNQFDIDEEYDVDDGSGVDGSGVRPEVEEPRNPNLAERSAFAVRDAVCEIGKELGSGDVHSLMNLSRSWMASPLLTLYTFLMSLFLRAFALCSGKDRD